jgi:hypothetical protein
MTGRRTLFAATLVVILGWAQAWSSHSPPETVALSRRDYVQTLAAGVLGSCLLPENASADVTNKVASSTALRSVKRAQKQLKDLLPSAQANDFVQVKAFLRTAPFVDVRKNCFILVRGGEDGPKAEQLQATYKAFIGSVEKIDATASLGMRGRKIPDLQMSDEFLVIESTLNDFLKVAEEATDIPVQYAD